MRDRIPRPGRAFPILVLALSLASAAKEARVGTDDRALVSIEEIEPGYAPWFALPWNPPAEVVEVLFVVQAALGAGAVGYFVGFRRGRTTSRSSRRA